MNWNIFSNVIESLNMSQTIRMWPRWTKLNIAKKNITNFCLKKHQNNHLINKIIIIINLLDNRAVFTSFDSIYFCSNWFIGSLYFDMCMYVCPMPVFTAKAISYHVLRCSRWFFFVCYLLHYLFYNTSIKDFKSLHNRICF